jgi:hypothetical protein
LGWFDEQLAQVAGSPGLYGGPYGMFGPLSEREGYINPSPTPYSKTFMRPGQTSPVIMENFGGVPTTDPRTSIEGMERSSPGTVGMTGGMVTSPTPTTGTVPGSPLPSTTGGLPEGFSLTGANNLASFSAPGLLSPFTQQFQRPTPESIRNDPSYQFQFEEGLNAINRDAAGQGTLLTGGTLKELMQYGQGLASTFDDKYWNRELGLYDRTRDIYDTNKLNTYNMLSGAANTGAGAATSYGTNVADLTTDMGTNSALTTLSKGSQNANTFSTLAEQAAEILRKRREGVL